MDRSDLEFLELYVKSFAIIAASKAIAVTRADTKEFLFVSQPLLKLLRQKTGDLQGKRLRDLSQVSPFINEYSELFKKVLQRANPVSVLIAHDFDNTGIKTIKLLHKEPIVSPLTGKILAIIDEVRDFTINREFAQFISLMNHTAGTSANIKLADPISLTKRQKEIIFLLSLGKSPKNIAEFISRIENKLLSPATVTAIINKHLYLKFGVNSTSQLIEKAILLGFVDNIPESFIRKPGILITLD